MKICMSVFNYVGIPEFEIRTEMGVHFSKDV